MKYHYQKGIVEKNKKGHPKLWLGFFVIFALVAYSGFSFAVLNMNGWPLSEIDATAKSVKTTKPGNNKIFIPAINLTAGSGLLKFTGDPSYQDVTVSGSKLAFGLTPDGLRQASPLYNLDRLKVGDEIFLDNQDTRYVYKVVNSVGKDEQKLTIKNKQDAVVAKTVGTIAWNNGKPELESL